MGVSEGTGGGVAFERGRGGRGVRTRSGDATRRDRSRRVRNLCFSGGDSARPTAAAEGRRTYAERGEEREEPRAYHDPSVAR
jgi:hypothetical protein